MSNDDQSYDYVSSKAMTSFSPHSMKLRESSYVKGGVEVLSSEVAATQSSKGLQPIHKSANEAQNQAHEILLRYAYTALSVPPPKTLVEKGEGSDTIPVIYPSIDGGVTEMLVLTEILKKGGLSVLKLNRLNQWQARILTVTKEVHVFKNSDDARFKGIDFYPKGLLWMKKFNDSERTLSSIGKKAKGGLFLNTIESVSVKKDKHHLSKKQQKGEFKDSFTFILHLNDGESKKDVSFRIAKKDDVVLLSLGFQAVIDRIKNEGQLKVKVKSLVGNKKKAVANPVSDDRWEV